MLIFLSDELDFHRSQSLLQAIIRRSQSPETHARRESWATELPCPVESLLLRACFHFSFLQFVLNQCFQFVIYYSDRQFFNRAVSN